MTGCFLRLRGKGGFTNCACCSRMIILLHHLNVSLNLFFSINTPLQCRSAGGICRSLSALMISLTSPRPHLECLTLIDLTFSVGVLWLIGFMLSSKRDWRHATHSLCSLYLHFNLPKSLSNSKLVSRSSTGQERHCFVCSCNHLMTKTGRVGYKSFSSCEEVVSVIFLSDICM